jgi:hypothetical protein
MHRGDGQEAQGVMASRQGTQLIAHPPVLGWLPRVWSKCVTGQSFDSWRAQGILRDSGIVYLDAGERKAP